jgi:hypothetical protein
MLDSIQAAIRPDSEGMAQMTTMPAAGHEPEPGQPEHPLGQLTTSELRDHRRDLESALAFFGRQDPVPPARDRLQARLHDVLAEQDERARIARARP